MARRAAASDARRVPWRARTPGFLSCPLCRSDAIRASRLRELDGFRTLAQLQCGACGVWRARELGARSARALDRRLRRDMHRMEAMARRLDGDGLAERMPVRPEATERWQLP